MGAAFTKGPWMALKDRHGGSYCIDTALGVPSTNVTVIADDIRGEQRHANARLIAAAPELYEAAETLLSFWEQEPNGAVTVRAAIRLGTALAKARGAQVPA